MIKAVIQSIPPYSMSVLNCQSVHVKKLKQWLANFVGGKVIQKRFIRWSGVPCALLSRLMGWALEISKSLIMLFGLNKCGDWSIRKTLCSTRSLMQNTSLMGVLWTLRLLKSVHMLGGVFYRLKRSLRSVLSGLWAANMGLMCGCIDGSQTRPTTKLFLQEESPVCLR